MLKRMGPEKFMAANDNEPPQRLATESDLISVNEALAQNDRFKAIGILENLETEYLSPKDQELLKKLRGR